MVDLPSIGQCRGREDDCGIGDGEDQLDLDHCN